VESAGAASEEDDVTALEKRTDSELRVEAVADVNVDVSVVAEVEEVEIGNDKVVVGTVDDVVGIGIVVEVEVEVGSGDVPRLTLVVANDVLPDAIVVGVGVGVVVVGVSVVVVAVVVVAVVVAVVAVVVVVVELGKKRRKRSACVAFRRESLTCSQGRTTR
jgi:hypothetical protein